MSFGGEAFQQSPLYEIGQRVICRSTDWYYRGKKATITNQDGMGSYALTFDEAILNSVHLRSFAYWELELIDDPDNKMKRAEINKMATAQLNLWAARNRDPGTMPCVPVIMINALTGEKPGIVVNLASGLSILDVQKFLKTALEQVTSQIKSEAN